MTTTVRIRTRWLLSIDVTYVPPFSRHSFQVRRCALRTPPTVLGDDAAERVVDVPRHLGSVSAHGEVSAVGDPLPQFGSVLPHPVLDVQLVFTVAGERGIQPGQHARPPERIQLVAVVELG